MSNGQSPERITGLKMEDRAMEYLRGKFGEENVLSEREMSRNVWDPTQKLKVAENHLSWGGKSYALPDALVFGRGPKDIGLLWVVEIKLSHFQEEDTKKARKTVDLFREGILKKSLIAVLKKTAKMPPNWNNLVMPGLDSNYVLGVVPADGVVDPDVTAEIIRLPQKREEIIV